MVGVFLPACSIIERIAGSEPKSPPTKVEAEGAVPTSPASKPGMASEPVQPSAPLQAKEGGVTKPEEASAPSAEEIVPASSAMEGAKEGAPGAAVGAKAAPPGAGAPQGGQQGKNQYVSLNFENADLELVLRSIADITGINFIIGPGVKANVTMRTTTKVPASEIFSVMESVLEVNNLVAVKDGLYYRIVPIAVAQQEPQDVQVGKERGEERERYVTQIVHLDHLSAEEMARILQPFLARGAKMVVHKETNSLIIAGFTSTVKRLLDTIKALDIPSKRDNIQRIFVYFVENVQATQLANVLNTLYGRRDLVGRAPTPGARPGQPPVRPGVAPTPPAPTPLPLAPPGQPPPGAVLQPGVEPAPGEVVGEVTIVPDDATNALIIKTSPRNYEFIEATIKQLDIVPKQVLIELLLAQITMDDTFQFSLEEIIRSGSFLVAGAYGVAPLATAIAGVVQSGIAPATGLTFAFVDKDKFRVVLNNLAKVTKVDVLASPHLLVANNKEAKLQVGQEVPIPTGVQTLGTTTSDQNVTSANLFSTFQRKDIGIIIGIKPHVNEKRLVTLEIEAENTTLGGAATAAEGGASFNKTTTKTSVVVQDGQSLLIAGIIRQDKSKGYSGIPFLSQIPLLGYLFRGTTETLTRNELLILITPHVIASPEEGRALTEQFKSRVESLDPILKSMPQLPALKP